MLFSDQLPTKEKCSNKKTNTLDDWQVVSLQTFHKEGDTLRCIVCSLVSVGETKSNRNYGNWKNDRVSTCCTTSEFIDMVPGIASRCRDWFCVRRSFETLQPAKRLNLQPRGGSFGLCSSVQLQDTWLLSTRQGDSPLNGAWFITVKNPSVTSKRLAGLKWWRSSSSCTLCLVCQSIGQSESYCPRDGLGWDWCTQVSGREKSQKRSHSITGWSWKLWFSPGSSPLSRRQRSGNLRSVFKDLFCHSAATVAAIAAAAHPHMLSQHSTAMQWRWRSGEFFCTSSWRHVNFIAFIVYKKKWWTDDTTDAEKPIETHTHAHTH